MARAKQGEGSPGEDPAISGKNGFTRAAAKLTAFLALNFPLSDEKEVLLSKA